MEAIVNVSENWGIGNRGKLLFSISADLQRFRRLTTGKTVVLGRKTLATFPGGRPLKNRENLVLSRSPAFRVDGAEVFASLPALLRRLATCDPETVCVIGGDSVYRALLPYCSGAQVTKTHLQPPADAFFPDLDRTPGWVLAEESPLQMEDGVSFQYLHYVNQAPQVPVPYDASTV